MYVVGQAYPKIAARIINGGLSWKRHPIDTLADYLPKLEIRSGIELRVRRLDIYRWLTQERKIVADVAASGSPKDATFKLTPETVVQWVETLTMTFNALRDALVRKGRCRADLEKKAVSNVARLLGQLHGLLQTGLLEFLLEDEDLAKAMGEKKRAGKRMVTIAQCKFRIMCSSFIVLMLGVNMEQCCWKEKKSRPRTTRRRR